MTSPADAHRIDLIRTRFPELDVRDWRPLGEGQNSWALLVDERWVFRFPKHAGALRDLNTEAAAVSVVAQHVSVAVPEPRWTGLDQGLETAFLGHGLIPGDALTVELFGSLDEPAQKRIAAQIGQFLRELHSIPVDLLPATVPQADSPEQWRSFSEQVRHKLSPLLSPSGRTRLERDVEDTVRSLIELKFEPTLRHGDFGPDNILFDEKTQPVTGIIDFGSLATGDPAIDLAGLLSPVNLGDDFAALLRPSYPAIDDQLARANAYIRTFPLQEALLGVEADEPEAIRSGLAEYM